MLSRFLLSMLVACLLVSCGDDSSGSSSTQPVNDDSANEELSSDSEVRSSSGDALSSAKVKRSSSSEAEPESSDDAVLSSSEDLQSSPDEKKSSSSAERSSSSVKQDESSSSAERSSSSVKQDESSSSAERSSSSVKQDESSSSAKESSSSAKPAESSSSTKESSSSADSAESSSSSKKDSSSSGAECSSSNVTPTGICKTPTEDNCIYGTLYDERDSTTYKTVKIGNQEWMAENLNYKYLGETSQSFCYDGEKENCKKYGRLYQWSAAIDSALLYVDHKMQCGYGRSPCNIPKKWKGVCPKGSHLPTIAEWNSLIDYLGVNQAGKVLKSINGWVNDYYDGIVENGNGLDEYGFTVLPSGVKESFKYVRENVNAKFWPANDYSERQACKITFSYAMERISTELHQEKTDAYSVRCIKD